MSVYSVSSTGLLPGLEVEDFPPKGDSILTLQNEYPYLYTPFERNYDGIPVLLWSRSHYSLAPIFALLYLAFLYTASRYMADRKPFDLKRPLKYWNLFLATFSFWGMMRVVPETIAFLYRYGWNAALCSPPVFTYGRGCVGLWTAIFIYSKYFELVDTGFIILRKRKLSFLHWYHHVTVLMYTWDAFVTEQPPGLFYCAMNYTVHAVMYFYYFLSATLEKPPRWGMTVTIMQIVQMIAGVAITIFSVYNSYRYKFMYVSTKEIAENPTAVGTCYISRGNMFAACAMYSTYFYLFAAFFVQRYFTAKKSKKA